MKRALVSIGLLGGVVVLVVLAYLMSGKVSAFRYDRLRAGDASKPILRMELVRDAAEVQRVLRTAGTPEGTARRKSMADAQNLDFWFIGAYLLIFSAAAVGNAGARVRHYPLLLVLVGLAVVVILGAGIADVFEDLAILSVIENAAADAAAVREVALWKWRLIAAAVMLQGAIVSLPERPTVLKLWAFSLLGSFAVAAGALCWWATFGQTDAVLESHINLCLTAFAPLPIVALIESVITFLTWVRRLAFIPAPKASEV